MATRGMVACGTVLGYDDFVADHVQRRCDSTWEQIAKLVGPPLDPQTKWNVLYSSLQNREAYLLRNTMCTSICLAVPMRQVETLAAAMLLAMCEVVGVPELTEVQKFQGQPPHRHEAWAVSSAMMWGHLPTCRVPLLPMLR